MTNHGTRKRPARNMDAFRGSSRRWRQIVYEEWLEWTYPYFEAPLREMNWRFWRNVWKEWRKDASV